MLISQPAVLQNQLGQGRAVNFAQKWAEEQNPFVVELVFWKVQLPQNIKLVILKIFFVIFLKSVVVCGVKTFFRTKGKSIIICIVNLDFEQFFQGY